MGGRLKCKTTGNEFDNKLERSQSPSLPEAQKLVNGGASSPAPSHCSLACSALRNTGCVSKTALHHRTGNAAGDHGLVGEISRLRLGDCGLLVLLEPSRPRSRVVTGKDVMKIARELGGLPALRVLFCVVRGC